MTLTEKLTELDQVIWKQYEKVTQYCNKEFGWNKYDLARKTNTGMGISAAGAGVYGVLEGVLGSSPATVGASLFCPMVGIGYCYLTKIIINESQEKEEISQLEKGVVHAPEPRAYRPLLLGAGFLNLFLSISSFLGLQEVPETLKPLSQDNYNILGGLYGLALASMVFFVASTDYFSEQIMTPPQKKKSVLKAITEKVTAKLQPAYVPQLEEAKYQSIDDVVGSA